LHACRSTLEDPPFCYRDDNVDACARCMYEDLHVNDTVNIGSDFEISIIDLAKLIIKITGSKSEIVHLPPLKEGDMTRRRPDITKMKKLLNRPMISLEEGIRRTIESGQYNF
jgi:Nucleoside-diphosphate-sugar epimerases